MSPITTPAELTPRFGLTDVHEPSTSPFDLEELFRAIRNWLLNHREALRQIGMPAATIRPHISPPKSRMWVL